MTTAVESAQNELASIVGASRVVAEESACRTLAVDRVAPQSVVYPRKPEEVAAVLKCAAGHDLAVIPCRNATKLSVGNVPRRYDIALSLKDLNNVWHFEPADLTASAEGGIKFGDFQELLARNGLWLPLDPPGGARASLGGILACNASGALRQLYGTPRDIVLGLTIATAEGKIIKTGGRVVKNVAGYDLTKLFLGSFGSLGVIVEANFKLFPLPAERATFVFHLPSPDAARELRRAIVDSPLTPMRMVLLNGEAQLLIADARQDTKSSGGMAMWVEAGGTPRVLERYTRSLTEMARAANLSIERRDDEVAKSGWDHSADLGTILVADHPGCIALKASMPLASTEEFVKQAETESVQAGLKMVCVAQTAAGVVRLYFREASDVVAAGKAINALREAARKLRGSLIVERCLPEIKSRVDVWGPPGDDIEIMRGIKKAWDPKDILAPGRFLGGI